MTQMLEPMLNEFREEVVITRRVLERVPADKLSWRPHPKSRGQLSVYLRLFDVPVPVIYGRSADENPFA